VDAKDLPPHEYIRMRANTLRIEHGIEPMEALHTAYRESLELQNPNETKLTKYNPVT
jgi:hypothetical protein